MFAKAYSERYKTVAEIKDINCVFIKVAICACCFVPPIKFCCAIGKTGDLFS